MKANSIDDSSSTVMGVSELWPLLKSVGITQLWSGGQGTHKTVVTEVEGKSVAVDLSAWIVQAICQPALAEVFNDAERQALIVCFNRVRLRFQCLILAAALQQRLH